MGESIAEGTLSRWLKKVGDEVKRDEPIFEISTDKVDAEIPAPSAGRAGEIIVHEGTTVPVNEIVARIETEKGAAVAAPAGRPLSARRPVPRRTARASPPRSGAPAPRPRRPRAAAARRPATATRSRSASAPSRRRWSAAWPPRPAWRSARSAARGSPGA
jgi:pyruvate dehydrogenase E2 component (dihydrolipoamide acetyltransferase)